MITLPNSKQLRQQLRGARWIWGGVNPRPINRFRLFRKEFDLKSLDASFDLLVFAEMRYQAFLNGRFVQTGPTPSVPSHRLVDRHAVRDFLRVGKNCVAFIVYCPGVMTGQWTLTNPGLLAMVRSTDDKVRVPTDASWQTLEAHAWRHPTQFCAYAKGFHEWLVARELPPLWRETGAEVKNWDNARELSFFAHGDLDDLHENYIGYPTLVPHAPRWFVKCGVADGLVTERMRQEAVEYYTATRNRWFRMFGKWNLADNNVPLAASEQLPEPIAERANLETHQPAPPGMVQSQGLPLRIQTPASGHPFAVFDLGIVRAGLLRLEIESESGGTVDVAWDDRIGADGRVPLFRATPNCDRVVVPAGRVKWDGFFERGARYLHVVFRDFRGAITIQDVGVTETLTVRSEKTARFECSDELLNQIWRAAAETTRLYLNGCGAGDPVRERARWFHDDAMATRMAFYCFGDWRTWRRSLELTAQSQNADGSFPVISPGHFEDFNMVSGCCFWVAQVAEYYEHTADAGFARALLPPIARFLAYESQFADGDGLLYETPGRRFLSWADGEPRPPYKPGETWAKKSRKPWGDFFDPATCGYNAIINTFWLWAVREAGTLAAQLGDTKLNTCCEQLFVRARAAFDARFWEASVGLHRDSVSFDAQGRTNAPTFCESTLFSLLRARLLEREQGLQCVDRILAPDFVCCRTSGGLDLGALPPFLIEAGRTAQALALYRDRWGSPIQHGATTSGEEFFQSGGNSDCHIHGATPARDFIQYLAGIHCVGPMWSEVLFAPPADGPDLRCSVPTPRGKIEVEISTAPHGQRGFKYSVPEGTKASLAGWVAC